jgi:hypothetical protein
MEEMPPPMPLPQDGWALQSILDDVGLHAVPAEYLLAVAKLRGMRKIHAFYERPSAGKNSDVADLHKCGQYRKVPPHLRLVDVEDDCFRHLAKAVKLRFPRNHAIKSVNGLYCEVADRLAELHVSPEFDLAAAREQWIGQFKAITSTLVPLDEHIAKHHAPEHQEIMANSRVGTAAALLESLTPGDRPQLRWADASLPAQLLHGMPNGGDGYSDGTCVTDTGLFRPIGRNAEYSVRELHRGEARPFKTTWNGTAWERARVDEPLPDSVTWTRQLEQKLESDADIALKRAGTRREVVGEAIRNAIRGDDKAVPELLGSVRNEAARERLEGLIKTEVMSRQECQTKPATMTRPKTVQGYREWADKLKAEFRPARRNCIPRGRKTLEDGSSKVKWRCCDDLRLQGGNDSVTTGEKVDLPSWLWCALFSLVLLLSFQRRGLRLPPSRLGLDDLKSAYRMVPEVLWPFVCCMVMWFSFLLGKAVVQTCGGHLYGSKGSNNNFSRVPRLACIVCCTFFLAAYTHYVDDFMNVDPETGGDTAHQVLCAVLEALGFTAEPAKWVRHAPVNVALGAQTDITELHTRGVATVKPEPGKAEANLQEARDMKAKGKCSRQQAENLVGRSRWLTGQLRSRAGTATLQAFSHRANSPGDETEWTADMDGSLEFLELVFDPEFMPIIEIDASKLVEDDEPCVILFTDSMYEQKVDPVTGEVTRRHLPVGWLAYDQADGKLYKSELVVPDWFYQFFPELKQYVTRGEIVAAIGAFYSAPLLFKGRRVIHFVDNAAALSNMVNGYATKPDMARFVNLFHAALIALGIEWYGEWVPSDANVADIMTRPERMHELMAGLKSIFGDDVEAINVPFELPPAGSSWESLKAWMRHMRSHAEEAQ